VEEGIRQVNRSQQRKHDKEIRRLMYAECCSICKKPLENGARTFGGVTYSGSSAYVMECCVLHLAKLDGMGVFMAAPNRYDFLETKATGDPKKKFSASEIDRHIDNLRSAVSWADQEVADARHWGGLDTTKKIKFITKDSPWKEADAAWFEAHPDRSHLVRAPLPGEEVEMEITETPEPLRRIAIRQVKPGSRIRLPLCMLSICSDKIGDDAVNMSWLMEFMKIVERSENEEAAAHALFDMIKDGEPLSIDDMLEMIGRYETSGKM
jgi:hypothetical protein